MSSTYAYVQLYVQLYGVRMRSTLRSHTGVQGTFLCTPLAERVMMVGFLQLLCFVCHVM